MKCVEQEVQVKACPQCRQLGARELLAQLRIADLSFLETPRLVQRHARRDDGTPHEGPDGGHASDTRHK